MSFNTIITTPEIDKLEFRELVVDLLEDFVHGDTSPFKDVKSVLEDYLDNATELEATQKAGIFSDWLKDSYNEINKQAMGTAYQILKANADFELQKYSSEADYNLKVAQEEKVRSDIDKAVEDAANAAKEGALLDQKLDNDKVIYMQELAKVKKQWGYTDATGPDAALNLAMGASSNDGAIDEQVDGYDKLHYKDTLKTMDEKAALMQNAKIPETLAEKQARVELIAEITDGLTYNVVDGSNTYAYTYNPSTPFGGSWTTV